jgi:hypothetical protein
MKQALLVVLAALAAGPVAAQVAPTLPRDTLGGRRLPPEANVPRGVVAPTLPRDTLGGARLPASANVVRSSVPTTPSDSENARSRDSVAAARDSLTGDSVTDTVRTARPVKRPASPKRRISR